jgi:membrane fusion protein, hemolysin D
MLKGKVLQVSADATERGAEAGNNTQQRLLAYRALMELTSQQLETDGQRHRLAPGMLAIAEIVLGDRTILEYLLSPVQKAFREAGRER